MKSVIPIGDKVTLSVTGGGCSGFQYVWGLMNDNPDVNWSEPIDDVLVVDPLAELYILGSEIDYVTELGGSFLAVKNPCLLYTSPSPRDVEESRMPSSA